jgi:4-hydroxy-2-oxoheptanedioate aldolase
MEDYMVSVRKREFLTGSIGMGMSVSGINPVVAQNGPSGGTPQQGYVPRRINKAIELLEQQQPIYYTGADPRLPGYEQGRKMAKTWADAIVWEMEHGTFDLANLREFMKGIVDGGPTASGHRFPAVYATIPVLGYSEAYVYANSWVVAQVLATGVSGISLCHARDPKAIEVFVASARYPFEWPGVPIQPMDGMRGAGSQTFAAKIWGVSPNTYLNIADVWPLNPRGEIILGVKIEDKYALKNAEKSLAVPGIAFAEGGGTDMSMSLMGLSLYADTAPHPRGGGQFEFSPAVQRAQARVAAACEANSVRFLHGASPETIIDWLKKGAMVIESNEETAKVGRAFTKRTMPV